MNFIKILFGIGEQGLLTGHSFEFQYMTIRHDGYFENHESTFKNRGISK